MYSVSSGRSPLSALPCTEPHISIAKRFYLAQGPGPGGDAQQRLSPDEEGLMVGFLRERQAVTLTPFLQVGGSL